MGEASDVPIVTHGLGLPGNWQQGIGAFREGRNRTKRDIHRAFHAFIELIIIDRDFPVDDISF
jgi:hypothetical protein